MSRFLAIFSSRAIGLLTLVVATPIIVRVLGRSAYGDYAFLLSALGVLMLFVDAGIFDGVRKFLAEGDRSADWRSHVFAFYLRVALVLAGLVAGGLLVLVRTDAVGSLLGPAFEDYVVLLAGLLVVRQLGAVARSTLMGFDRERVSETLQVVNKLVSVAAGLALLLGGYGIAGLLAGRILGHALMATVGFAVAARHVDLRYVARRLSDTVDAGELLRFNTGSFVLFGLYVSILHLDVLLIQWFQGSTATGTYRAALTLAEFLWFVPRILQMTLLHSTSKLWSDGAHERITALSARMTRYTLSFTTLLVIGLAALARPVVTTYYGPAFEPAVRPLLILLPGALGFALARPILAIGQGNGNFRRLNYATGAAALLNLVGNLVLIPRFGIEGAAVATTTSYLSMFVFHVWSARAIGFDPTTDLRVSRIALTAVLSSAPIFALATVIESSYLALAVVPPVGFVVYATLSLLSGAVDLRELPRVGDDVR